MHKKKIENLLNFSAKQRYEYFVREVAGFEQVWGLVVGEDNWVIFKDSEGDDVFPIWPHSELAIACRFDEHKKMEATPQAINLKIFLENCIPDMVSNNVQFGIFYNQDRAALVVDGDSLKQVIVDEVNSVWE